MTQRRPPHHVYIYTYSNKCRQARATEAAIAWHDRRRLVGAMKAGTTALSSFLQGHPDVSRTGIRARRPFWGALDGRGGLVARHGLQGAGGGEMEGCPAPEDARMRTTDRRPRLAID